MIHYIKGVITETMPGMVAIENGGIGYEVHVPDGSSVFLAKEDELITLYTAMLVREDDISLYGFTDKESLAMFNLLMTVSGVGAKAALAVLSALSVRDLRKALVFEDVDSITRANGIGKKTAQRIVLELKDKVKDADEFASLNPTESVKNNSAKEDALAGLMALGYSRLEAMSALVGITDESLSTEEYIRMALRRK